MSYLIPLVEPWYDRASGWSSHAEGMRPYWYVAWDPSGGSFTMTSVPLADLRLIQRQVPAGSSATYGVSGDAAESATPDLISGNWNPGICARITAALSVNMPLDRA
jgi:hypothetical protein